MFNVDIKDLIPSSIKNIISKRVNSKTYDLLSYRIWINLINEVLRNNNYIEERHINYICDAPAINRLYSKLFYFFKPITISDIAINISFELMYHHIHLKPSHIIQLTLAIRERIIEEILNNNSIREIMEVNGVNVLNEYIREDFDDQKLIEILMDKKNIRTEYFSTYSTKNSNHEKIRVYLPNEHEYIDWAEGPNIDVYLNSYKKIELGFFRIGYDYKLVNTNEHLRFATLSKDKKYEVAEFSITRIGEQTDDKIWAL